MVSGTVPLRDLCESGGTPYKANAAFWVGDIPWFRLRT
jgi:hypothetical protein